MSREKVNISNLAELEQEERRVRKRIKKNEAELLQRVKKLPEEIVTSAIVKLVSGILEGNALKSVVNFAKKVGKNVLSGFFKENN